MRQLRHLEDCCVKISIAKMDSKGRTVVSAIERALKDSTKLIAVTHASNVPGKINDIETIGNFCKNRNIRVLVDAV
jgi:cysteine desulfurase/selenocysteine lyase